MMLKILRRIVQTVESAPNFSAALAAVVESVQTALQTDVCSIFIIDDEQGEYVLSATLGLDPNLVESTRLNFGETLVGFLAEREELLNLENMQTHPRFVATSVLGGDEYQGFLGVPIIDQGQLLGMIVVQQKAPRFFIEEEEAFLVTLSAQLAQAVAMARAKGTIAELGKNKRRRKKNEMILGGVAGSPGIAIGHAIVIYPPADLDAVPDRPAGDIEAEINAFEIALVAAREELYDLQIRAKESLSIAENALFDAYLRILDSRTLMSEVIEEIKNNQWAQGAVKRVMKRHIMQFEALEDSYLQERAADFRDLGRRILAQLQTNKKSLPEYPKKTLLVSDEVTATMLMEVPRDKLVGVISGSGSANSHVAILARALGLPTVMGVAGSPINQLAGKELIVDGYNGQVYVSPTSSLKKEFRLLAEEEEKLDAELQNLSELPAETRDGCRIALWVNTGLAVEGSLSLSVGAEGIGLYRTELPFMTRERFPTQEEQRIMYRQLLQTFAPRPVIMRTLDIGGDKTLSYFPVEEENPFLGWRGIRITLDHPEIFLQQIKAMLLANVGLNNLSIMLPMIASVSEVEAAKCLIQQAYEELKKEENVLVTLPRVGIMIEVPSAVYQAYDLAKRVDFVSVGSNDLIQYLLAVDRNNPRVADLYNGFHPAVIRALADTAKQARRAKRPISICGELAGDPCVAVLLLGMGFHSLSMSARNLLRVKWAIRQFSYKKAKELVKEVLIMDDPVEVRCHMELALEEAGLGSLIRAGL